MPLDPEIRAVLDVLGDQPVPRARALVTTLIDGAERAARSLGISVTREEIRAELEQGGTISSSAGRVADLLKRKAGEQGVDVRQKGILDG